MVIGIFIAIVILVILLWRLFIVYRIPIIYFVYLLIEAIPYTISLIILITVITRYLLQVPPSLRKRALLAYLSFMGLSIIIIFTYLFHALSLTFTLVGVGILPPLTKSYVPSIINATLEEYVLLNCHGTNISSLENLNKTMSIPSALSQSFIELLLGGIIPVAIASISWLLTIPLLGELLEHSSRGRERAYNTLCYGDKLLFSSYITITSITYFIGFSIIVYSLAILSSSEFPYAYAMLITTFLVLIVETLMIRNGGASSPWPWVALYISVVSSLLYTVVAFYISGFILPSACLTGINNDVLSIYEFSLPLAGIFGAIPYALTLLIIHHRIMCPRVEPEETKPGA
jgi:hypothetical protein